jgi:serine/threonine protein phosphatase PrpC
VAVRLEVRGGFSSETGSRAENEDIGQFVAPGAAAQRMRGVVAAVADGIGGAPGGRDAAEIAVATFIDEFYSAEDSLPAREAALRAIRTANEVVIEAAHADFRLHGMGTTLSALVLRDDEAIVVHVGDSRIYRLRGRDLTRLTEDHNMYRQGFPNILTRSLGAREDANPDSRAEAIEVGDRFLLATDGVTAALSDAELSYILLSQKDPGKAAQRITAAALGAGTTDNATALVVDVAEFRKG